MRLRCSASPFLVRFSRRHWEARTGYTRRCNWTSFITSGFAPLRPHITDHSIPLPSEGLKPATGFLFPKLLIGFQCFDLLKAICYCAHDSCPLTTD
ncbi:hypothetical protein CEXT_39411 [Caerostris extrusa]|uniref:Uncharacterized protein n=1 Tax=Caerostris extrusa TaxID=172846 RepID=A0AAV4MZL1_CAEEX|nr:hypothetical protein CEXT_39411 [Caerostris extrusa]